MAEHVSRPVAPMDPPHMTEFGSRRYIEKLNASQQQAQQQQQQQQRNNSVDASSSSQPTFILPLRESYTTDVEPIRPQESKKRSIFSIRQRVPLFHSRSSVETSSKPAVRPRSSAESARWSVPFDERFHGLPNELQIQIISYLPLSDVLNLRLVSSKWHSLVTANEAPLVRHHLDHNIPAYARRLYPITDPTKLTFHYLCSLWHRLHVAAKLSYLMCEWITRDLFLRVNESQRLAFAPQNERMRRRLIPLLFTIFHFFENYRELHLEHIAKNGGLGLRGEPYTLNPIEAKIMNMYDDRTLLRVHEVFPLVISSFLRRLRPPTYVGRVERSLRGYIREKPTDDMHVAILCIGGLREVEKLWEIKGYNTRRGAVDTFMNSITKDQSLPESAPTKPRRGLFGRKKSTAAETNKASVTEGLQKVRSSGSIDATNMGFDIGSVFNTSLAAGAPMSRPERQQAQAILNDLPVLQQIWLVTAEAMILERRVVERPQDIKRNQQVMLDLIREDGCDEEDEWWYGRNMPTSVRPATGVTDDDAD
ncbi:hypothetical protein G7046_g7638 [Stylonectria norvegica]|nr:hypothetical protein G7046_g7638 [Stylonectria norvegica]